MRPISKLTAIVGSAAALAALALPAVAGADGFGPGGDHDGGFGHHSVVYVQTNDPTGNQVVTYLSDGSGLHEVGRTDTGGLGVAILTTSKGLLKDAEARRQKIGGELLCKIW